MENKEYEGYWVALMSDGTYKELWGTRASVIKWLNEREYSNYRLVKWRDEQKAARKNFSLIVKKHIDKV